MSSKTNFSGKRSSSYSMNPDLPAELVELLAFTGYEPYITLNDGEKRRIKRSTVLTSSRSG